MIRQLCDDISTVPRELLDAIKKNAETFDGCFNDGRIFRDGQLFLPDDVIKSLGLPEAMKKGVSGNLAKMMGASSSVVDGSYRGTYEEISKFVKIDRNRSGKSFDFIVAFDGLITYPEDILK